MCSCAEEQGSDSGQPAGRATHGTDLPFYFDYGLSTASEHEVSEKRQFVHCIMMSGANIATG
jgi:hypothetical protein